MSSPPGKRVVLVAAVAENGVIGSDGSIPWRIPGEQAHFKAVTMGHTLVMGRATYESIGRPLPGRTTVVLTRDPAWTVPGAPPGVLVAHSFVEAVMNARELPGDVMVVGGAEIYNAALPLADAQVLTEVHLSPQGDTFYPAFDRDEWMEVRREPGEAFDLVWLERTQQSAGAEEPAGHGLAWRP